jgi:hypothetical protein
VAGHSLDIFLVWRPTWQQNEDITADIAIERGTGISG